MPPLWLISGTAVILGITALGDHLVVKPRGTLLVVDGKSSFVRRKRDRRFLIAVMLMFLALLCGDALIEGTYLLIPFFVGLFGGMAIWSVWLAIRTPDSLPNEKEVRAAKSVSRRSWALFAVAAVQMAFAAMGGVTGGVLDWILVGLELALLPLFVRLLCRFLRAARSIQGRFESWLTSPQTAAILTIWRAASPVVR